VSVINRLGVVSRFRPSAPGQLGDKLLMSLCAGAGLIAAAILVEVVYQLIHGASPAISRFGIGFLGHTSWAPNFNRFGAASAIYGTIVSAIFALCIATPLGIAIGIYLAMIASSRVRQVVGPIVEMMAAVPSIIIGVWGVLVLAPFVQKHVEPFLHSVLGFLPIFGTPQTTGLSLFTAGLVLAFMILPIIASLSRDLFLTVPQELKDGAEALGATRWEMIRGVVLPSTFSGVAAATVLGLGRALGEAIAVSLVMGDGNPIKASVFEPGVTLAARIATDFPNYVSNLQVAALYYLSLILLCIVIASSLLAQWIGRRFGTGALARAR
jgi:phosphate transport system permease protein